MLEGVWVCFEIPRIYVRLRESGKSDLMALHEFAIKMGNRISTTSESKVSRKILYIYTYFQFMTYMCTMYSSPVLYKK